MKPRPVPAQTDTSFEHLCRSLNLVRAGCLLCIRRALPVHASDSLYEPGKQLRTGVASQVTLDNGGLYVNNSAHRLGLALGRRITHVAIQLRMGLLPKRRFGSGGCYCTYSGIDGSSLAGQTTRI